MRRAVVTAALLAGLVAALGGCHYEASVCEESPGSGCAECTVTCEQLHGRGTPAEADCNRGCTEGRWVGGCG